MEEAASSQKRDHVMSSKTKIKMLEPITIFIAK
jgi:hypothetical protein